MTIKYHIVFHASESPNPPHSIVRNPRNGGNMFHAGTLSAGIQRIQLAHLDDEHFSPIPAYIHVYEVPVKEGAHVYDDPSSSGYTEYHVPEWDIENALDERKNYKEVVLYTNAHEDSGSISFFVPKNIGAKHYVGSMPFMAEPEIGNEEKVKQELGYGD